MSMVAYSPLLHLVESYVAAYKIYVLRHPDTKDIFYVGQTVNDLQTRLSQHLTQKGSNQPKNDYIQALLGEGKRPIIEEIETIHGACYRDRLAINDREVYWIKYYKSIGCKLLNSTLMSDNAACNEWNGYLKSLKRGETSWHYYLCGKTISGIEVYDEKKLNLDGFSWPRETPDKTYQAYEGYNPWKNQRFLQKMGNRISIDDPLSYEPCYKDTNPEYYDDDY